MEPRLSIPVLSTTAYGSTIGDIFFLVRKPEDPLWLVRSESFTCLFEVLKEFEIIVGGGSIDPKLSDDMPQSVQPRL